MHIGTSITPFGHHRASGLKNRSQNALQIKGLSAQVRQAQNAKLDFVFFSDNFARRPVENLSAQTVPFEPTTLIAALATVARDIGLIASAAMDQHEPYNLARRFASLDIISHGRSGWNYIVSSSPVKSAEYIDVVFGLWDSWEDDAFIYDKTKGRFFRPEKMHVLNHAGKNFTVRGPLNVNRSPQGRPVATTMLNSQTLELAVQKAELIFVDAINPEELKSRLSSLHEAFDRYGRERSNVKILVNIVPYIGTTADETDKLRQELDSLVVDGGKLSGIELVGTAPTIADQLEEWNELVDGFISLSPLLPDGCDPFIEAVVPELQKRGVFREDYTGRTLREHLSLPRPTHPTAAITEQSS